MFGRGTNEHVLLIVVHHIVFDGRSVNLLLGRLFEVYELLSEGRPVEPRLPGARYEDFVAWEQALLASEEGREHLGYWQDQLAGPLPLLMLPTDRPRHGSTRTQGATHSLTLAADANERIRKFLSAHAVSPSVLFLGLYQYLLHRYTGESDIIVGVPSAGRPQERFEAVVGYFVNMMAIRSRIDNERSLLEFLSQLRLTLADGLDHAVYPFPALVRELKVPRTEGQPPIFQVAFEYQSASIMQMEAPRGGILGSSESVLELHQEGEYELTLEIYEQPERFVLNFKYDPELMEQAGIERMAGHYLQLLEEALDHPGDALKQYRLLTPAERRQQLDWNDTARPGSDDRCVHELFEMQAGRSPEAVAIRFGEECLSYGALEGRSETLARCLQSKGVGPNRLVGVCLQRSPELLVALLGILKAGGAYVPLDPDYPQQRLQGMLEDSTPCLVVTQASLRASLERLLPDHVGLVQVDDWQSIEREAGSTERRRRQVTGRDLAYVIYTSGSTGKPKGVMIEHGALSNFLISMAERPGLSWRDRLLAVTTYSFDIAGLEFYLPLVQGAECCLCATDTARDPALLRAEIERVRPTIMQATPATWTMLLQSGWRNATRTRVLCGGEALTESLKQQLTEAGSEVWNLFGPTETTIWSTVARITAEDPITIGQPIANTQIYILDAVLKLLPVGVAGELYIGGAGLARGYLNRAELTAERFIASPFGSGERLYRTGDLARYRADGNIEYLGRIDTQVKIRGFRIELGEIEAQLTEHPGVNSCAVVARGSEGARQLCAFYVPSASDLNPRQLREHLLDRLPSYMVPARFVSLARLPLTPSGKVDRKALCERQLAQQAGQQGRGPRREYGDIAQQVLSIWREVLESDEPIGPDDGFFEVGGDSLQAVVVAERIGGAFKCEFAVTSLFRYGTLRGVTQHLADVLGREASADAAVIELAAERPGSSEQHPAQQGRYPDYYASSLAIIGISCNLPGAQDHWSFWENLRNGKESVEFLSEEELRTRGVSPELIGQANYVPARYSIAGKELFDAGFFKFSPKDAELMDPQLRLLLQHAWKAVEDAGYVARDIADTSVFISSSNSAYQALAAAASTSPSDDYLAWLLAQSGTIPTLISHRLGLRGASYAIHSNCSSSLTGLHAAQQAILSGQSRFALVGASMLFPYESTGYVHQAGMNFSSDGHVKAFDAAADGMVGGEGVAVLLLKKASEALRDRDHVYAVIRGVELNNDGADKAGFYAPSVQGQADVIDKVLRRTGIDPATIGYVEAQGPARRWATRSSLRR